MDTERQKWYQYITVEPIMFLYMFAFQLTSVIEQDFFVKKACRANLNYTDDICNNLNAHNTSKEAVHIIVSNFHQWNHIAGNVFTIIIALFIGSWSDKRGRKIPLLIGLTGKVIYVLGILLNIHFDKWPVEYIIPTATIPSALTGIDIVIFASSFAYISDISSVENRTMRVSILDACYLIAFPVGTALGSYLFKVVNQSYMIMFSINGTLLIIAILYAMYRLEWRTSPKQQSIRDIGCTGIVGDFFDRQHVAQTIKTLCKNRPNYCRTFLWILLCAMFFYTFQRDERNFTYLYTISKFNWNIDDFSNFRTFQSALNIPMLFIGVPTMTKLIQLKDTTISMLGAFCFASARFFYAFANVPSVFYYGAIVSSFGPVGGPLLRSMTSKVVPASERGKVFAMLSVCDNAVPLVSSFLYNQLYIRTIDKFPAFFILTAFTQMVLFFLMLTVHFMLSRQGLTMNEIAVETPDRKNDGISQIVTESSSRTNILEEH